MLIQEVRYNGFGFRNRHPVDYNNNNNNNNNNNKNNSMLNF